MTIQNKNKIRDVEAKKHGDKDWEYGSTAEDDFKAGWDARNKIDNEDLRVAVEALECVFKNSNANRGDWHRCREALEEIRKLRE